jgi:hypothetical protein
MSKSYTKADVKSATATATDLKSAISQLQFPRKPTTTIWDNDIPLKEKQKIDAMAAKGDKDGLKKRSKIFRRYYNNQTDPKSKTLAAFRLLPEDQKEIKIKEWLSTYNYIEEKLRRMGNSTARGGRKSRKSRKTRKTKKTRKSRKSRKH